MKVGKNFITINKYPTGTVGVKIDDRGGAEYMIQEPAAWDYIQLSAETIMLAKECDAVCFGSLAQRNSVSRNSIYQFLACTSPSCLRGFDINLRQKFYSCEIIENSLRMANVLKLNEDELDVLCDLFHYKGPKEQTLFQLGRQFQLDYIALTRGSSGSIIVNHQDIYRCLGFPVSVRDTVGAGDAFTAVLIIGMLYGLPFEKINQLACKVGSYVCSQAGAVPTLPTHLISELNQSVPFPI